MQSCHLRHLDVDSEISDPTADPSLENVDPNPPETGNDTNETPPTPIEEGFEDSQPNNPTELVEEEENSNPENIPIPVDETNEDPETLGEVPIPEIPVGWNEEDNPQPNVTPVEVSEETTEILPNVTTVENVNVTHSNPEATVDINNSTKAFQNLTSQNNMTQNVNIITQSSNSTYNSSNTTMRAGNDSIQQGNDDYSTTDELTLLKLQDLKKQLNNQTKQLLVVGILNLLTFLMIGLLILFKFGCMSKILQYFRHNPSKVPKIREATRIEDQSVIALPPLTYQPDISVTEEHHLNLNRTQLK